MKALHLILNLWYTHTDCPNWFSKGLICLIPKPGKENKCEYTDKRPITLLPDLAKIPMKIIATRLQSIFHKWPSLLDHAQNGFIREGSCDGPIRFAP